MSNKTLKMLLLILYLCVAAGTVAAETAGCEAGAIRASRLSDNPDYCISCPETDLGGIGTPKIALCTPKRQNVEVISSNDIIVSGVGGETIIVQNRRLLATSLEQKMVSDVACQGDTITPVGIKCFYGENYATNIDPNITDTTGKEYTVDEFNAGITVTSAGIAILPNVLSLTLLCVLFSVMTA